MLTHASIILVLDFYWDFYFPKHTTAVLVRERWQTETQTERSVPYLGHAAHLL